MKLLRSVIAICLVFGMAMFVVACSSSNTTTATNAKTAAAAVSTAVDAAKSNLPAAPKNGKKFVIGVSLPVPDNQWVAAVVEYAKQEAQKDTQNYDVYITTSNNPSKQAADVEDLLVKKPDVMVLFPLESAPLTPVAEKITSQGIPLLVLTRGIESENYTTYIHGDDKRIGVAAAHYIGKRLNGKGSVVEMQALPCAITTDRTNGFEDTIKKYYPGIQVIARGNGGFAREPALKSMENILQANQHIDAVYSEDDEQALGCIAAIKAAGREGEMFVTGVGGNKGVLELMMKGDKSMAATFSYSPFQGGSAVQMAKLLAQGKPLSDLWEKSLPKEICTNADTITPDNAQKYYDAKSPY